MGIKKVAEEIRKNKRFLITTHINPEGDALGSELAFYFLLKALGKKAVIVNDDKTPYGFEFLPAIEKIKRLSVKVKKTSFDCFVFLDCSDFKRSGEVYRIIHKDTSAINIDHHISNTKFANTNWVNPYASSCAQMVYELFKVLKVALNRDTALLLYVGILTDTGSFHYSNTTSLTHKVVSDLLKYNIDVPWVYRSLYENKPYRQIKIFSEIARTIKFSHKGKIAWFVLSSNSTYKKVTSFDLAERLLNFARGIEKVEVALVFKEIFDKEPQVRVNLRSQSSLDVNKVANFFGGGGHPRAASCTIKGNLKQAERIILHKINAVLKEKS